MDDLLETATRCPHCSASVRPGAPWCTLCHTDLRPPPPAPEPAPTPKLEIPPTAAYSRPAVDPLTAPATTLGLPGPKAAEPTWPCSTCGATNVLAADACASCGAGFLSVLRESASTLPCTSLTTWTRTPASLRSPRAGSASR